VEYAVKIHVSNLEAFGNVVMPHLYVYVSRLRKSDEYKCSRMSCKFKA
jgi:hypothetical protein